MSLEIALAEIKQAEIILRSRYHYEHPIFGHLAIARESVEAELATAAPPTPEPEPADEGDSSPATTEEIMEGATPPPPPSSLTVKSEPSAEGQPPARRARRGR